MAILENVESGLEAAIEKMLPKYEKLIRKMISEAYLQGVEDGLDTRDKQLEDRDG